MENAADDAFEAGKALAELMEPPEGQVPDPLPDRLPLDAIVAKPGLFQPRPEDGGHVDDLVKGFNRQGELEAVLVYQRGSTAYLLDGHHRMAA